MDGYGTFWFSYGIRGLTYCVIKIDPDYVPAPIERKQVFGVTFEQGRNEVKLDDPAHALCC